MYIIYGFHANGETVLRAADLKDIYKYNLINNPEYVIYYIPQ